MKVTAVFQNGMSRLSLEPEDSWEKKLLGAVAKGGDKLEATVEYKPEGHFTHGDCEVVHVLLSAG